MTKYNDGYDVGDIVDESWGYDQTNVDFYRIVKRTAKTVWLEHIPTSVVYHGGPGGDKVVAGTDRLEGWPWYGKLIRRKLHFRDGVPFGLSVRGFGWASRWSGEPVYQTDTMFGH